ncbi:protein of unknown function [Nitrospina watsonii]|uniref:Uncharacterized protein n=1 Tax=Nitrospina watsonii TaxID=1323948 RepID=A0ABM9HA79_9BACT|nr:protein of unknown function [Nitrospina watsonii]
MSVWFHPNASLPNSIAPDTPQRKAGFPAPVSVGGL